MPIKPQDKARILAEAGVDPTKYWIDDNGEIIDMPEQGTVETALKSTLHNAPRTALGFVGSAVGAAGAGALATPETAGLATIPAALAGGAAGGLAGGAAGQSLQDWLYPESWKLAEEARMARSPITTKVADIGASMALMRPSATVFKAAARAPGEFLRTAGQLQPKTVEALANIGLGAGMSGGMAAAQGASPGEIALETALGATQVQPTWLGTKLSGGLFKPFTTEGLAQPGGLPTAEAQARFAAALEAQNAPSQPTVTPEALAELAKKAAKQQAADAKRVQEGAIAAEGARQNEIQRLRQAEVAAAMTPTEGAPAAGSLYPFGGERPIGQTVQRGRRAAVPEVEPAVLPGDTRTIDERLAATGGAPEQQMKLTPAVQQAEEARLRGASPVEQELAMLLSPEQHKYFRDVFAKYGTEYQDVPELGASGRFVPRKSAAEPSRTDISSRAYLDVYPHEALHALLSDTLNYGTARERAFTERALRELGIDVLTDANGRKSLAEGSEEALAKQVGEESIRVLAGKQKPAPVREAFSDFVDYLINDKLTPDVARRILRDRTVFGVGTRGIVARAARRGGATAAAGAPPAMAEAAEQQQPAAQAPAQRPFEPVELPERLAPTRDMTPEQVAQVEAAREAARMPPPASEAEAVQAQRRADELAARAEQMKTLLDEQEARLRRLENAERMRQRIGELPESPLKAERAAEFERGLPRPDRAADFERAKIEERVAAGEGPGTDVTRPETVEYTGAPVPANVRAGVRRREAMLETPADLEARRIEEQLSGRDRGRDRYQPLLDEEARTRNLEAWRQGAPPRRAFHGGTFPAAGAFKLGDGTFGKGIYLSSSKDVATKYSKERGGYEPIEGGRVDEYEIRLRNPLVVKPDTSPHVAVFEALGMTRAKALAKAEKLFEDKGALGGSVKALAEKQGYDGIIYDRKDGTTEYVLFDSNQAKLVEGNTGEYSYSQDVRYQPLAEDRPIFATQFQKELDSPNPLGAMPGKDGRIPANNLRTGLARLNTVERELLANAGLEQFLRNTPRPTVAELKEWADGRLPKIEIRPQMAVAEASKVAQARANLLHELESYGIRPQSPDRVSDGMWFYGDELMRRWDLPEFAQEQVDALVMHDFAGAGNLVDNSATARFTTVNPRELKDMPGAVDILVKMPDSGQQVAINHYPKEGKDLVTHVRAYEHTLPDGTKALRVFELQSDWGQERRKLEAKWPVIESLDKLPEGWRVEDNLNGIQLQNAKGKHRAWATTLGRLLTVYNHNRTRELKIIPDNPILSQTDSLGLKAAIEYARERGISKLIIDDAETAMMTERHDQIITIVLVDGTHTVKYKGETKTITIKDGKVSGPLSEQNYWLKPLDTGDIRLGLVANQIPSTKTISQSKGMTRAYNDILPQLMRKMTGDKGVRVNMGEHKNAFVEGSPRDDLFFKNPDGSPKTESTGIMYDLGVPQARRAAGEPFTVSGERYQPLAEDRNELDTDTLLSLLKESKKADSIWSEDKVIRALSEQRSKPNIAYGPYDIGESYPDQTSTPQFLNFFGDWVQINKLKNDQINLGFSRERNNKILELMRQRSKVVDDDGGPMIVYHGSQKAGFTVFDLQKTPELGFHFGTPEQANSFVAGRFTDPEQIERHGRTDAVYPVYLDIKNPFYAKDRFAHDPDAFVKYLVDAGLWDKAYVNRYNEETVTNRQGWNFIKEWLTSRGHDGIKYINEMEGRVGDPKNIAWVAFSPTQIKSAIGNRGTFDPSNPDIRYQPLGPERGEYKGAKLPERERRVFGRGIFAGNVEALRRTGDPQKIEFAGAMEELYARIRNYTGQYEEGIIRPLTELSKASQQKVVEALYDESMTRQPATAGLSPDELAAHREIRAGLLKMRDDQIAANHLIEGKPAGRDRFYFPHVVDSSIIHDLSNTPESPRAKEAERQFIDLNAELFRNKGIAPAVAQRMATDAFGKFIGSLKPISVDSGFDYGAVSMPAGTKLPPTWVAADPVDGFRSYIKRFSRARAFYDVIGRDENAMRQIGRKFYYDAAGKEAAVTNPGSRLQRDPNVRALLENALGITHESQEGITPAIGRLANSLLLGNVATRLTDAATTPFKALAYLPPQYIPGLLTNMRNLRSSIDNAYKTGGVRRGDMMVVREVLGAGDRYVKGMDKVAETITKYTGSEALEKGARFLAQNIGEYIYDVNKMLADRGDKRATDFMNRVTPKWRTLAREETAQRIARLFQGNYDATNLPIWIANSPAAPFFSMMKWNIEQWNNFKRFAWEPALKGDPYALMATVLGGVAGGIAVGELREKITGKKQRVATAGELNFGFREGDKARASLEALRKAAFLAQVTGTFGIVGELSLQAIDVASKDKPQGFSWPAYEFVSNVIGKIANAVPAAIERPEDALLITGTAANDLAKDIVAQYRILWNAADRAKGAGEVAEANRRRDLRMSEKLRGEPTRFSPFIERDYRNERERQFDKARDRQQAIEIARQLDARARRESTTAEEYKDARRKFRTSRIVGIPSRENNPQQFYRHLQFVRDTQGAEAADQLARDYATLRTEQKWKSSMFR